MFKVLLLILCLPLFTLSQQSSGKSWTSIGVKGKIIKDLDWAASFTARIGGSNDQIYFPQASIKYKVTKWFRPSLDYRAIFSLNNFGNYSFTNRLNLNAEFKHILNRFSLSARVRYQYSFDKLISTSEYDSEYDQAIRFKPQISYDINNSFITPVVSVEWFYNPAFGPLGQRFTKYRAFVGVDFEFDSPHEVSIGYMFDQQINRPSPSRKHILSINYAYNLGFKKKKKKN
jgi:hypothetical protein